MTRKHKAKNWNKKTSPIAPVFWKQLFLQIWSEEEIIVSSDKSTWVLLTEEEQEVYKKVLAGLTLLDTKQADEGMTLISLHVKDLQEKAVLKNIAFMEEVHAKSYSHIFTTLDTEDNINELFKWVENHPHLQAKASIIAEYYDTIFKRKVTDEELYMALVTSVLVESYLFYSGFFYPLFLAGQGKMTASGEMINLILRDESVHGVFGGLLAQNIYNKMDTETQIRVKERVYKLVDEFYVIEEAYTKEIYAKIGMVEDVLKFVRYNGNKALMNLGFETHFPEEDINPIVLNGLKTDTKNHDFFSVKGNGYIKAVNIVKLSDEDFTFNF